MHQRLVENALSVFAQHGIDSSVIHKVITGAEVSRGTFYNYFRTDQDLFSAVAMEVSNEILRIVDPVVRSQPNGAARVACGVRLVIELARDYPILPKFIDRGGLAALRYGQLVNEIVPRDLIIGVEEGLFKVTDIRLALDFVLGPVFLAFHTIITEPVSDDYGARLAKGILMSLGISDKRASSIVSLPLNRLDVPEDSLFNRASLQRAR